MFLFAAGKFTTFFLRLVLLSDIHSGGQKLMGSFHVFIFVVMRTFQITSNIYLKYHITSAEDLLYSMCRGTWEVVKNVWKQSDYMKFVATEKQSPESIAQLNCFASLSQLKVTFSATTSSCFREKALKNLLHTMCSKYSDMFIEKLIPNQLNSCENSATVWYNPDEAHLLLPFFPLSM